MKTVEMEIYIDKQCVKIIPSFVDFSITFEKIIEINSQQFADPIEILYNFVQPDSIRAFEFSERSSFQGRRLVASLLQHLASSFICDRVDRRRGLVPLKFHVSLPLHIHVSVFYRRLSNKQSKTNRLTPRVNEFHVLREPCDT